MKINCYDSASLMRVMLHARGLWIAMSEGTSDYTEDRMAPEVISKAVPVGMMSSIASKASTKVVWESITLRNVGVDRVHMVKARSIKHEFDSLMFDNDELVDDFGTCIG
jgi:regulation of enolase protein 1 (concanavalin A-like superfamily)